METQHKIVKNWKQLKKLVQYCKQTGYCSFDFETNGLPYHHPLFFPTVISISFQIGSAWEIPLGHAESPFKDSYVEILEYLSKELFENPDIIKICWNLKFEHKILMRYQLDMFGRCFDAMLAKYLLDEERPNGLKDIVLRFLPEHAGYDDELDKKADDFDWATVPLKRLCYYCGTDSDMTFRLMMFFEQRLIKLGFYNLFRNLVMPNSRVLAESEFRGMYIDASYLDKLVKRYSKKIAKNSARLQRNRYVKKFEKAKHKGNIKKAIKDVKAEIKELRKEGNKERMISNREEKVSRLLAGEFASKKDLKLIEPVNFDSPLQMVDLLFNHRRGFGFDVISYTKNKKTKKETDTPSTGEDVLLQLKKKDRTGFIKALLKNRELTKLYSTYIIGMQERLSEDNRIHGSFLIHGTVTGRLSSRGPNLQNIPRVTTNPHIKKMFIPPKGYVLLEVDYSQAELRIVAELSKDEVMIDMFRRGHNIHVATAAMAYTDMSYEEFYPLTKDENHPKHIWAVKLKKKAKTYNFGVLYGQAARKLSETIAEATGDKPNIAAAEKGLKDWFKTFPGVKRWIDRQHKLVGKQGYVYNMFGRKRRLPDIYSPEFYKMLEAQRQSVNAPVQGGASDFTQFSSVLIRDEILIGKLPKIYQCYTVHDSLGYYIKPKDLSFVIPKLVTICADPETKKWFGFQMKYVKMKVSPEVGGTWAGISDYDPKKDYTKLLR